MELMNRSQFEDYVEMLLETLTLEDILERYDISPEEVLMDLYDNGKITEDYGQFDDTFETED